MIRNILRSALLSILLLYACKTYSPADLPAHRLQFGSGGGFTGMVTEYTLLRNGQLFVRTGRAGAGEWEEMSRIKSSEARSLYQRWHDNTLFKERIQQPGNRYYFINMQQDSTEYRQSWGASDYTPDDALKAFFDKAMELVKTAAPDNETNR